MNSQNSHQLGFEIDYANEDAGWMNCFILIDDQRHHLDATNVFPPFLGLLRFVKAIAAQQFPYTFSWDEEGPTAKFEASSIAPGHPNFRLAIKHMGETWLDGDVSREHRIQTTLSVLDDFTLNCDTAERGWGISRFALADVKRFIDNPKALPYVHFVLEDGSRFEDVLLEVRMALWIGDKAREYRSILDTSVFWSGWFAFLEKIAHGQFPAEFTFLNDSVKRSLLARFIGENAFPVEDLCRNITFRVVSMDVPQNFQLTLTQINNEGRDYLAISDVLEVNQFLSSFYKTFEKFFAIQISSIARSGWTNF